MTQMMSMMTESITTNNLEKFKKFLDSNPEIKNYCTDIKYSYSTDLNTYFLTEDGTYKNSSQGLDEMYSSMGVNGISKEMMSSMASMMGGMGSVTGWTELIGSTEHIMKEYELVDGRYPQNNHEIVLIVDENNQISDYTLYVLGIRDFSEVEEYMKHAIEAHLNGTENTYQIPATDYSFEEIYSFKFKVLLDSDHYIVDRDIIRKLNTNDEEDNAILNQRIKDAIDLSIVGIVKPSDDSMNMTNIGTIGYMSDLMDEVIGKVNRSDVVLKQIANHEVDLFTGIRFDSVGYTIDDIPLLKQFVENFGSIDTSSLLELILGNSDIPFIKDLIIQYVPTDAKSFANMILDYLNKDRVTSNTYEGNLKKLGYVDLENPSSISIYPKDFDSKEKINALIADYNAMQSSDDKIIYTDTVALLMSSVTTIVDAISYVLIAFVAISLVVSSIMIGIITYISVLERTKEIGILRAIGASKKDIARVFNAETLIIGLTAGSIGIFGTMLLCLPINAIVRYLTGIPQLTAYLPWQGAVALLLISMVLTIIAGLIPSRVAAKKDPVVALRTE